MKKELCVKLVIYRNFGSKFTGILVANSVTGFLLSDLNNVLLLPASLLIHIQ